MFSLGLIVSCNCSNIAGRDDYVLHKKFVQKRRITSMESLDDPLSNLNESVSKLFFGTT